LDGHRISLITPFVGKKYCIEEYFKGLLSLDYDKNLLDLVFYDGSNDCNFKIILYGFINKHPEYGSFQYVVDGRKPMHEKTDGNIVKTQRVASVYENLKQYIKNELVFVIEDDIEVPVDALKKLLKILEDKTVGMALGRQICRWGSEENKTLPLAWEYQRRRVYPEGDSCCEEQVIGSTVPILNDGLQVIDGSGMGCNLLRSSIYKREIFRGTESELVGYDLVFGKDIRDWGYKIIIDWSIHCKHYHIINNVLKIYE
jgi:hypothetical protein